VTKAYDALTGMIPLSRKGTVWAEDCRRATVGEIRQLEAERAIVEAVLAVYRHAPIELLEPEES
jgi:hypothetical protein